MTEAQKAVASKGRPRLRRVVQLTVEIGVLGYLVYFFASQSGRLSRLEGVGLPDIAALAGTIVFGNLYMAGQFKYLVGSLGARIAYGQAVCLSAGCTLLNYLPLNAGMIVKARFLKKHLGVKYAHFISLVGAQMLAVVVAAGAMGLIVTALTGDGAGGGRWHLAGLFAAGLGGALMMLHIPPSWLGAGGGWLRTALRDLLVGLERMRVRPLQLAILLGLAVFKLLIISVRFQVCFAALGVKVTFLSCLMYAAVTALLMLVSITPNSLGLREILVGGVAALTGLSFEVGLLASGLDRVCSMVVHVLMGLPGLAVLRKQKLL